MIFVGIDPGKSGAIATIEPGRSQEDGIMIIPTPVIQSLTKAGKRQGRPEYDLPAIRRRLVGLLGEAFVTVEKGQPLPPKMKGGTIANYHRGVSRGYEWMLVGLGLPHQLVAPATWQKEMLAGTPGADTKQRAIIAAGRLFPAVDLRPTPRCKKPSDGFADALLLAAYGMRKYGGVQ